MRAGWVPATALLLAVFCNLQLQVKGADDLYLENEEDPYDEFLEVKEDQSAFGSLNRKIRQIGDFFSFFNSNTKSTTVAPANFEDTTEFDTHIDEINDDDNGSGSTSFEGKEKTVRVSFVINEPYYDYFSNRDSLEFRKLSKTLADSVNVLYERLPGVQRATLVRIQSRISDSFSCKVTLDIVTNNYDDTNMIKQILHDRIKNHRKLGPYTIDDQGYQADVIDPGSTELPNICLADEIECDRNNQCIQKDKRCDGVQNCDDGSDEIKCKEIKFRPPICAKNEILCDHNTCISGTKICDKIADCEDGSDEQGCGYEGERQSQNNNYDSDGEESITDDPIKGIISDPDCEVVKCENTLIEICKDQLCDRKIDCAQGQDEINCDYQKQKYTLDSNNYDCPEGYQVCDSTRCYPNADKCDGVPVCHDGADERDCPRKYFFNTLSIN